MATKIIALTDEVTLIGRAGEQGDLAVAVDATAWKTGWPDGTGGILVTRPDGIRIPLVCELDGTQLIGSMQPETMSRPGVLKFEANWVENGAVKASASYTGLVMTSQIERGIPKTGPFTPDWAKEVYIKAEQILSACDAALQMTEYAEAAAASAQDAESAAGDADAAADRAETALEACEAVLESIPEDYIALSGDVTRFGAHNILFDYGTFDDKTLNAVVFTWDAGKTVCTVNAPTGPTGNPGNRILFSSTSLAEVGLKAGETYLFDVTTTNNKCCVDLYWYTNGTLGSQIIINQPTLVTVPTTATGVLCRIYVYSNAGVLTNEKVSVGILTALNADFVNGELQKRIWPKSAAGYVSSNSLTLGSIVEDGRYIIDTSWTVTDAPAGYFPNGYTLTVENYSPTSAVHNFAKQTVEGIIGGNRLMFTRMKVAGTWTSWLNVRPLLKSILTPTGDSTDRKTEIEAALTADGAVILAPGDYYVSGITMPDNTDLRGSGMGSTRLILIDGSAGTCVAMGTQCNVSDLTLYGQDTTIPNTNSERHGLGWVGTYQSESSPGTYPKQGAAHDLYIEGFAGGAIYCTGTSMLTNAGIQVTNVTAFKCYAGIFVKKLSEFNSFTNVRVTQCTIGCINNGGNNVFANCNFSSNWKALLMDDTASQSPNNSHGSFVACVFNHSGNNEGYAVDMIGMDSSEIFSGCQFFFGKTRIVDSIGIRFDGCNFGAKTDISVSGTSVVEYDACQFKTEESTPFEKADGATVKFSGCLLYDGAVFDPTGETAQEQAYIQSRTQTPEITPEVSGAVASFADGADGIPMRSVLVNIEPIQAGSGDPSPTNVRAITGRTGLTLTRCRKNLLPTRTTAGTSHGLTYTPVVENGLVIGVSVSGTQDGSTSVLNIMPEGKGITLPAGTYIFSGGTDTAYVILRRDTSGGEQIVQSKGGYNEFTLTEPTLVFCNGRCAASTETLSNVMLYPMICRADDTDETFEPYQGDTYTVDWTTEAGTVYSGTLDVVTGLLTVDKAMVDLGTLTWDLRETGLYRSSEINDIKPVSSQADIVQGIAENYRVFRYSYAKANLDKFVIGMNNDQKRIYVSGGAAGTGKFVYELETPQTYQLTPQEIASLLGENNVFADSGNTAVKYTADTKLYIDNKIASLQALILENT